MKKTPKILRDKKLKQWAADQKRSAVPRFETANRKQLLAFLNAGNPDDKQTVELHARFSTEALRKIAIYRIKKLESLPGWFELDASL
jgi:hypothetical protein